jgi:serine-type D-Ala-D-Ala carboxypeptidase (penicillin-binding protein 5/6)
MAVGIAAIVFAAATATTVAAVSGHGHVPNAAAALVPKAAATSGPKPVAPLAYDWLDRNPQPDVVSAESGIVVDLGSRRILWHKDALSRRAPASLTKIVTAMVAADKAPLDRVVTVPAAAARPNPAWTMMGLDAGDQLTVGELMTGMFTVSGNDAAETLAQSLEPRSQFIAEMNAKVASLGLADTHFANPTGLDARGQYSTAYDLAVLAGWLELHYPTVFALAAGQRLDLPETGSHKAFDAPSLNKLLWLYPGATGLKTGATGAAGGCLVGTAERGGRRLVVVDLHSDVFFTDAMTLLDYGYAH